MVATVAVTLGSCVHLDVGFSVVADPSDFFSLRGNCVEVSFFLSHNATLHVIYPC